MTKRQWLEPRALDAPADLRAAVGGHRLIAEHLTRKGITTPGAAQRFLSADQYEPAPADELPDMDRAVDRLARAIRAREGILIWGDFDVDGQTSTALLFSAL
ncbi:MAG: single-stranded-DNA-specific exonuclease RecJ, partial [Chloroflexota bacterium]|nr:single-stranded-DNA-specific exonuclease RecJ [Chloroflexota bacterium]